MKKIAKVCIILCVMCIAVSNTYAQVSVGLSVRIAPPILPVYVQPACPVDGYLWEPGYWAYDDADGYYWVPGVWVAPPDPGYLWTPPYWGYEGGYYGFHGGYWGPHVGFYGGVNYGGGYIGVGFVGGMWSGGRFRYNTAVVNVNRTVIHNTYVNRTVINNRTNSRASFNGPGGITARPRPQELSAMREHHVQPTGQQMSHQQMAKSDRNQFATVNHGRPAATALNKVNGRPFNQQGHIAKTSAFGHGNAGANSTPATHQARVSSPANTTRPTNSGITRPQQQARQQHVQQQVHSQPRMQQQQAQQQQHAQQQRVQQQQAAQHMQQHMQQRVQQQQPRPQQHVQQQQPRPQQQQHSSPRQEGGRERHR